MAGIFSDDFKELVRSRTDIVSLIGESVGLQARGREFVGLCPFHDDHHPSMRVYPERQSYRCWSCNEGGDCFSFVMKHERVEFREALEMLAARANLEMPKKFRAEAGYDPQSKSRLYEVLAWAENEFHECLLKAPFAERARKYLADRRMTAETIAKFRLGYHPANSQWIQGRAGKRFTPEQLHAVRLVGQRDGGGGYYDYFMDRVMFPIHDSRARPVAFGGRILPDSPDQSKGKYFNSPESPVFVKSRILYGLDAAREAITKAQEAVLMEGYVDCIMSHQFGLTNVVCALGTALNETHVTNVKRFARRVVLVFDGDGPGRTAAEKSLPKFLAQEVDLRILTLPNDLDPADFLLERGADAFRTLLSGAVEAWEHKFRAVTERFGLESIDARHRVLQEMLEVLSQVPLQAGVGLAGTWQERENIILGKLAQRLSISEQIVRQRLHEVRSQKTSRSAEQRPVRVDGSAAAAQNNQSEAISQSGGPGRRDPAPGEALGELFPKNPSRDDLAERELLEIVFTSPETVAAIAQEIPPAELANVRLRELLELAFRLAAAGIAPSYERITASLEDAQLKRLAGQIEEHARQRNVHGGLLSETLAFFRERREMKLLVAAKHAASAPHEPHAGLSDDVKERLRLSKEMHQKRITKKTLT